MPESLQNEETPLLQRVKNALSDFREHAGRMAPFMQEG